MKNILKTHLSIAWKALTLTILFFYPLIATLHDSSVVFQWQKQNTYELLSAIALLTIVITAILSCIERYLDRYFKLFAYIFISIVPLISFGLHFLMQLGYKGELINLGQYVNTYKTAFFVILVFITLALLVLLVKYPARILNVILALIIILSPINILAGWTIWKLRGKDTLISIKKEVNISQYIKPSPHNPTHNIVVLLFDEMSYDFLYRNGAIDSRYPNIKYFSSISDNYHAATAPGKQTLTSLPGMLNGRRYEKVGMEYDTLYTISEKNEKDILTMAQNNLFSSAQRKGFKTLMFGPYLPYCDLCGASLDECRSFSIYNYGTIERKFSLIKPFLTTFIIWPHQYPQGIIKNLVISKWQKELTRQTYRLTMEAFDTPEPFFLFTHFYFTHVPFVFCKDGYYENKNPFLQNAENYRPQLDYADRVLGELIARLKSVNKFEQSTIIVLADHNYRVMFPTRMNAIPLIVKKIGQSHKRDIYETVNAEVLLKNELNATPVH